MAEQHTREAWTVERIREAFIYDGGEAEYHDPIDGAREQRRFAGEIFDAWLAAHDAQVLRDAAEALDASASHLDPKHPVELTYINCTRIDAQELRHRANRIEGGTSAPRPVTDTERRRVIEDMLRYRLLPNTVIEYLNGYLEAMDEEQAANQQNSPEGDQT